MASQRRMPALVFCVSWICVLLAVPASPSSDEELLGASFLNFSSGLACELAKCLRGKCVNTSSFPFYRCECNEGWQSPFGASWMPCILPNCSIDLTCANTSEAAPAASPSVPLFSGGSDVCSLHVCGNGQCVYNSRSAKNNSDDYECMCNAGYVNLGNSSDGYCIRKCSIGADCTNVNLPFGGAGATPPPPPPAVASPVSSSSPSANEGGGSLVGNRLLAVSAWAFIIIWR